MGTVSIANTLAFAPNFQKGLVAARKIQSFLLRLPLVRDRHNAKNLEKVHKRSVYLKLQLISEIF